MVKAQAVAGLVGLYGFPRLDEKSFSAESRFNVCSKCPSCGHPYDYDYLESRLMHAVQDLQYAYNVRGD